VSPLFVTCLRHADALAEDGVHRFFKFVQVCLFLYIGAASGNWTPGNIQTARSSGLSGNDAANTGQWYTYFSKTSAHKLEDAEESFKTVVIAFTLSRAQLAIQYLICTSSGCFTYHKLPRLTIRCTIGAKGQARCLLSLGIILHSGDLLRTQRRLGFYCLPLRGLGRLKGNHSIQKSC
jgi:hypothetical protein